MGSYVWDMSGEMAEWVNKEWNLVLELRRLAS
jgi:hypothetical protein